MRVRRCNTNATGCTHRSTTANTTCATLSFFYTFCKAHMSAIHALRCALCVCTRSDDDTTPARMLHVFDNNIHLFAGLLQNTARDGSGLGGFLDIADMRSLRTAVDGDKLHGADAGAAALFRHSYVDWSNVCASIDAVEYAYALCCSRISAGAWRHLLLRGLHTETKTHKTDGERAKLVDLCRTLSKDTPLRVKTRLHTWIALTGPFSILRDTFHVTPIGYVSTYDSYGGRVLTLSVSRNFVPILLPEDMRDPPVSVVGHTDNITLPKTVPGDTHTLVITSHTPHVILRLCNITLHRFTRLRCLILLQTPRGAQEGLINFSYFASLETLCTSESDLRSLVPTHIKRLHVHTDRDVLLPSSLHALRDLCCVTDHGRLVRNLVLQHDLSALKLVGCKLEHTVRDLRVGSVCALSNLDDIITIRAPTIVLHCARAYEHVSLHCSRLEIVSDLDECISMRCIDHTLLRKLIVPNSTTHAFIGKVASHCTRLEVLCANVRYVSAGTMNLTNLRELRHVAFRVGRCRNGTICLPPNLATAIFHATERAAFVLRGHVKHGGHVELYASKVACGACQRICRLGVSRRIVANRREWLSACVDGPTEFEYGQLELIDFDVWSAFVFQYRLACSQ